MKLRISGIAEDSIVDGPGMRIAIFAQGCGHGCPGCHNPDSHDPAGGTLTDTDQLVPLLDNPMLAGITLSGGEPFDQPAPMAVLAEEAHRRGLNVWVYSGYLYEDLCSSPNPDVRALLDAADVLVDGPFRLELRSLALTYRGSSNQRIIDLAATRSSGNLVTLQLDF